MPISDQNWPALPELLDEFARALPKAIDEFFRIVYPLLYHGQIVPLLNAMNSAWSKIYAADNDITPWGIDELPIR